ncbi:MAG: hypothetical protein NTX64_02525 [Elusimicrobia bacterium]|nr:hypothetical protein [Elusimicrobiota bacterium]
MARAHSFKITLSNNKTEIEGFDYLLEREPEWFRPDTKGRKQLLQVFGLEGRYARAFDLVWVRGRTRQENAAYVAASTDDVVFIELKTTKKKLPDNPYGFFFGATKNEFDFAERLGDKFCFCFTCLHPEVLSHKLLSLQELEPLIKTKRVQFQINLTDRAGLASLFR